MSAKTGFPYSPAAIERFLAKTREEAGCLIWTGASFESGYGTFTADHRVQMRAHRAAWEIANGRPIPEGMMVLHSCDRPACVNYRHLRIGNDIDNVGDRTSRGRTCKGERHTNAKLTDTDVHAVRRDPRSLVKLAREYGVARSLIQRIKQGKHRAAKI